MSLPEPPFLITQGAFILDMQTKPILLNEGSGNVEYNVSFNVQYQPKFCNCETILEVKKIACYLFMGKSTKGQKENGTPNVLTMSCAVRRVRSTCRIGLLMSRPRRHDDVLAKMTWQGHQDSDCLSVPL